MSHDDPHIIEDFCMCSCSECSVVELAQDVSPTCICPDCLCDEAVHLNPPDIQELP